MAQDLEKAFVKKNAQSTPDKKRHGRQRPDLGGFEVTLLSDEELELSVKISTLASRYERRLQGAFDEIFGALKEQYGDVPADAVRSVIGVFPLINRFSRLVTGAGISMPRRVALMGTFEFHVLEELDELYEPLASMLCGGSGPHTVAVSGVPHDRASAPTGSTAPQSVQDWMQLLHAGTPAISGGSIPRGSGNHSGAPVHLSAHLSRALQPPVFAGSPGQGAFSGPTLYDQVISYLQTEGVGSPESVASVDLDVLRLVSLFFETFLDDASLASSLRLLVARLQLPVLQLVLEDLSFFEDASHVGRRLIDQLCDLGVGWASDLTRVEHNTTFQAVNTVIEELATNPQPDIDAFEAALSKLQSIHQKREKLADRAEGRVVELEVGRAKLKAARKVVQDTLNDCLQRYRSPSELRAFFVDIWSKVLTFVCLRQGTESEGWAQTRALSDELADQLTPASTRQEAQLKTNRLPHLLERLEAHMVEAGLTSSQIDQSVERLYSDIEQIRRHDEEWFASDGSMVIEEPRLPEPITLIPETPSALDEGPHQTVPLADVKPGDWARISADPENPEHYEQVKVAARVCETNEILLVDERGARWGLWSEAAFAAGLKSGSIKMIDHQLVVQRTLNAMIAQLTSRPHETH